MITLAIKRDSGFGDLVNELIYEAWGADMGVKLEEIKVEHPGIEEHGDYSTSIAMVLGPRLKRQPRDVAAEITERLKKSAQFSEIFESVEVAGPGFINLKLKTAALADELGKVLAEGEKYGSGSVFEGKKIMVEFTDPNPFKEFHIGHVYSNSVGESLSRLIEFQGAAVWRVTYQGDVGLHVAKAMWGMNYKIKNEILNIKSTDKKLNINANNLVGVGELSFGEKARWLGEAYAIGAAAYEGGEDQKKEIEELNKKIYAKDPVVMPLYEVGKRWSLEYFDTIYSRLGSSFRKNYFESDAGEAGVKIVREFLAKGIFEESQGAVVFPGEKYDLHTRVFINSMGLPTYEAKELGLAPTKYKDFAYDQSIIVTGNEINEYFKVLLKAMSLTFPELAKKTVHIGHGMVRLPTGKMASRKGNVLTGEWLIDEAHKMVLEIMGKGVDREADMDWNEVAEEVAVGAVKYAMLRSGIGKDIEFDFKESVNFEGSSGPYLQYTYARTQSVLRKRQKAKGKRQNLKSKFVSYSPNQEELAVLRWIYRFGEVAGEAAVMRAPNLVCSYLFDLAQRFNTFYNRHSILGMADGISNIKNERSKIQSKNQKSGGAQTREFRLVLTAAVGQVIRNGLWLLGIKAPSRM